MQRRRAASDPTSDARGLYTTVFFILRPDPSQPDADLDDEIIGFHAQQAVEKSSKAWLAHLEIDYPKVHSLETLLGLLNAEGHALPPDLDDVSLLTPFATVFRYEDLPLSSSFDRANAIRLVRGVLAHVKNLVGKLPVTN